MKDNFVISSFPHIFDKRNVPQIMWGVVLALLPAVAASIYFFRQRAVMLILACVFASVITEALFQKIRRKTLTLNDGSAVVTGLLLALVLPATLPLWMAVLGTVVAVSLGKQIFGGLGYNIFNPALIGRAFLMASFPVFLTTYCAPYTLDAISSATPLGLMKFEGIFTPLGNLFLGDVSGSLGETSSLALILGGLYLLYKKYIDWRIPLGLLSTVIVFTAIVWLVEPASNPSPLFHLFSGGLMLGVWFMATDPVTTPITKKGRWIFGAGCGVLLIIIRLWGGLPEGMMYSILLMNAFTPLINRYTKPRVFGGKS